MTAKIDPADIPVVIPAGGLGMRMREETERVPKPMVEVGGRPIIWHIMKVFAAHGHRKFIICLGYKGWVIKDWFLNYQDRLADLKIDLAQPGAPTILGGAESEDWEVICAETGLTNGTVGRLQMVSDYIDAPYFMYAYGDSIGDVDVTAVRAQHEAAGRLVTVTGVRPRNRYGIMMTEPGDTKVTEFFEKPMVTEGHANGGFMALDRSTLDEFGRRLPADFLEDVLPTFAQQGQVGLYDHNGFWLGMDTMRDVAELEGLWSANKAPWKLWNDA